MRCAKPNDIKRAVIVWVMCFGLLTTLKTWERFDPTIAHGIIEDDLRSTPDSVFAPPQ